jgi:hypothetical protein
LDLTSGFFLSCSVAIGTRDCGALKCGIGLQIPLALFIVDVNNVKNYNEGGGERNRKVNLKIYTLS